MIQIYCKYCDTNVDITRFRRCHCCGGRSQYCLGHDYFKEILDHPRNTYCQDDNCTGICYLCSYCYTLYLERYIRSFSQN